MGYLYLLPWMIGFLVFQFYPLLLSLFYSFTNFSFGPNSSFVGLGNYISLLTSDKEFQNSLGITFKYVFMSVPMKLIAALLVALILNAKLKGMNTFRTIYYLPSIMGGSVGIAILWRQLFEADGMVNNALKFIGLKGVGWLSDSHVALFTISLLSVWQFGSSMIFFLAALKQVPAELYEAAKVDGSTAIHMFFKITLPMISPITLFNLVMQMINAFQEYTSAAIITNGGPMNSTQLYGMLLYKTGFSFYRMGYASAQSWILFVIIIFFTALVFKSSSYWTFYEDEKG
jgi:oligogalacturonide transport system permease protein